jgi:D-alanyl-D-alanine carboxypeptidase
VTARPIAGRRRFLAGAAALALAPAPLRASAGDAARERALDKALAATLAPGAVVGIARPGAAPAIHALGHADLDRTRPMSAAMHFRIGSVAKPFAGTAVLRLAESGRLDLDAPVARFVSGVPEGERITLDMLGRHASGLFNPIASRAFQAAIVAAPAREWSAAELLAVAAERPLAFAPGSRFGYSNTNTVLLAMAAERAADEPWPELLRRLVLDPLGVSSIGVTRASGLPEPSPRGYRYARRDWPIGYGDVLTDASGYGASWAGAAGDLHATAADLARAAAPLASGALLGPAARARLHDWRDTGVRGERHGFHLFERDGRIGHPGDVPGFSAALAWQRETGVAVIALANLSNTPRAPSPALVLAEAAFKAAGAA